MSIHYLIDGYNLLYALPEIPRGDWPQKRALLLQRLRNQRPQGRNEMTVVFDSREGSGDQMRDQDMQIVYAASETADDWISRKVREVPNPRILVVVTDDQGLRRLIRGTGAKCIGTKEFLKGGTLDKGKPPPSDPAPYDTITEELKRKWL